MTWESTMQITNNNISFQSKIKLINAKTFKEKTSSLSKKKHEVGYPWTPDTMKVGKKLYTTSIQDCISGVIIDGSNKAVMFHLCTRNQEKARQTRHKGFDIKNIERRIMEKINPENEDIHAFILGGSQFNDDSKYNRKKVDSIRKIFEKHKIPYSEITCRRNTHVFGSYSIFYNKKEDTIYVSENRIGSEHYGGIKLENNIVSYQTYEPRFPYKSTEKRTGVKEFLESQFRNVNLCKLDEFA